MSAPSSTLEHAIIGMKRNNTICFVAGRSGGHLLPAITLAQHHKEQQPNDQIIFITTTATLDQAIIKQHPLITHHVMLDLGTIPKRIWHYPSYFFKLVTAFFKCCIVLKKQSVTKIVSTGGYLLLPTSIAAKLLSIPITLYELNALPGKAVKVLAPLAHTIYTCFASAQEFLPKQKCAHCSYPIKFREHDKLVQKDVLKKLQFSPERKTIFVLGGSQGSVFINRTIHNWLERNKHVYEKLQIIHQTGNHDEIDWQAFYEEKNIPAHVFVYTNTLSDYYNAADIIICRAGAGTLFEIVFFNKRCITIPLETQSTNHQISNAQAMMQQHPNLITMVTQKELETDSQKISHIIEKNLTW